MQYGALHRLLQQVDIYDRVSLTLPTLTVGVVYYAKLPVEIFTHLARCLQNFVDFVKLR